MATETDIWTKAAEALAIGEGAVLMVVAESKGSSPGRAGFKMLVTPDAISGSVGGGVMEVALVDEARRRLVSGSQAPKCEAVFLVHRPNVPNASGMICSGSQSVILLRLEPGDRQTVDSIIEGTARAIRIDANGLHISEPPSNDRIRFADSGKNEFEYEETLGLCERLFIVGGGHCALALSELVSRLGFRIELFDDRSDLNTLAKNTFADRITIVGSYDEIAEHIPEGDDVYVVVMTLGYRFDEIVIRRLFGRRFRYFGVLGSRAKMKTLLNSLKNEGFDERILAGIRTPVGLPINSRTPEEIAVSIAAEIILVRNSDSNGPAV